MNKRSDVRAGIMIAIANIIFHGSWITAICIEKGWPCWFLILGPVLVLIGLAPWSDENQGQYEADQKKRGELLARGEWEEVHREDMPFITYMRPKK